MSRGADRVVVGNIKLLACGDGDNKEGGGPTAPATNHRNYQQRLRHKESNVPVSEAVGGVDKFPFFEKTDSLTLCSPSSSEESPVRSITKTFEQLEPVGLMVDRAPCTPGFRMKLRQPVDFLAVFPKRFCRGQK